MYIGSLCIHTVPRTVHTVHRDQAVFVIQRDTGPGCGRTPRMRLVSRVFNADIYFYSDVWCAVLASKS
jgi:hypothetical protein